MSQYPSPYSPQQPVYGGYPAPQPPRSPEQLLAPARRAGTLMIVLGVLFVIFGLCMAGVSWMIEQPEFVSSPQYAEMQQQFVQLEAQSGVTVQTLLLIAGIVPLVLGALLGGLGFFVRGGGLVPIILAIALSVGLELFFGLVILVGLIQGLTGSGGALAGTCMYVPPFGLLLLLLFWLIQAAWGVSKVALARQQYQAQVWQYQQYQQAYLQQSQQQSPPAQGMGYHYPPATRDSPSAPSTSAAPPPPADESAQRKDTFDGAPPQG